MSPIITIFPYKKPKIGSPSCTIGTSCVTGLPFLVVGDRLPFRLHFIHDRQAFGLQHSRWYGLHDDLTVVSLPW